MKIHHIAIWTKDLELMKSFYTEYFGAIANEKYINKLKDFESYFLTFENETKIELMYNPGISKNHLQHESTGFAHIAIKVSRKDEVDNLTARLKKDGYKVISEPRVTGDGYYESCFLDPEGNRVEIVFN